ncbi:DNA repair protein RecN [Nesterenkonia xinjiangensis]|uniref:DNA repair protein RecN n=1 Tax=Nesterenkonia xinjiangensis TaxID=225327 RepID=A0A7Z0K7L9_9MICC|nr:DNA repair protein RecN [Nesterenkonia xinjiangensis]NYJ76746.1 DNA repair protein RecN (Recombination protein N) [Nesterenkonia xinjiangensis]
MIEHVTISDLGVIERAELELDPGLNVVTGETGAGKTMVVTALGLLLGSRADASAVRSGAPRAAVDAELRVASDHRSMRLAREAGAWIDDADPDETDAPGSERAGVEKAALLLGRAVSAKGRSRASVSGRSVPISLLGEIGSALVTVHGQTDQLRLKSVAAQRRALDSYAGQEFAALAREYRARFEEYQTRRAELEEITTHERERRLEAEQLQQALEQIDEVDPQPGEDERLKAESLKLENVEALREAARTAQHALSGPDAAETLSEGPHAVELVEASSTALAPVQDQDEELADIAEQIASVSSLLDDAASQLGIYAANLDESGPERLGEVHQRRADLDRLSRLYGPDVDAVLAWAEEARRRLNTLQSDDDRITRLTAEIGQLELALQEQASELRRRRTEAGHRLAEAVGEELAALAMPHARMVVDVTETEELGPHGADVVAMLLAPHAGAEPLPLGKGASGGELSRVMLAIEVVLAAHDSAGTFIFDEVDAGVGGKAAVQIGRRLAMLAEHVQVIVVTHLPQVAAWAQNHIRVYKSSVEDASSAGGFTASDVRALDEEERVSELARMLAGQEDSASARAHAKELLEAAGAG